MDYQFALLAAQISVGLLLLAIAYYVAKNLLLRVPKKSFNGRLQPGLRQLVQLTRRIHPYAGLLLFFVFPYHAYVMLANHPFTPTVFSGLALAGVLLGTMGMGMMLRKNPGNIIMRGRHRAGMYLVLAIFFLHRIV